MRRPLILAAASLALAACEAPPAARVVSLPPASMKAHSEPVFYNGKHYTVDFAYSTGENAYNVKVSGKGRKLAGSDGDRRIVEQIATSAVRHFACPSQLKGQVVPGTTRHTGSAWELQARCA